MAPNICNVSYTHVAGGGQSAGRAARYITRRPEGREEGQEPTKESDWRELDHIGSKEKFVQEAGRRRDAKREHAEREDKDLTKDKSPGAAQYNHVVLSPERSNEMSDEELYKVAREWVYDDAGGERSHLGAVHRGEGEGNRAHVHLLIADDKMSKSEIEQRKEASGQVIGEIERGLDRDQEREPEPYRAVQRDHGEERDLGAREQRPDQGEEIDR